MGAGRGRRFYGLAAWNGTAAKFYDLLNDHRIQLRPKQGKVEAGVNALLAGGDFADGAITQQGAALGGTVFATFDRKAVATLAAAGFESTDPAELVG